MTRRPKRDKKRQARLTFEPAGDGDRDRDGGVGASSSPAPAMAPTFSTAKVRYSRAALPPPAAAAAATGGSPSRPSPSPSSSNKPAAARTRTKGSRGKSQSRLPDPSIGVSTASSPLQKPPSASFMPKQHGVKRATFADSSDESAAEVDDAGRDEDDEDNFPLVRESAGRNAPRSLDADEDVSMPSSAKNPRSSQSVSTRLQNTVIIDDEDEDDDDDDDVVPPSSALKRRRPLHVKPSNEEEDDDDDDVPIIPPSSALRRRRPAMIELEDDEDDEENGSPTKKRKTNHPAPSSQRTRRLQRPPSSPVKRTVHKGHRSEKEKKMELLRRRRAGEKIDKLSSSESESEGERQHRGVYDTDSEDEFKVLKEFADDEDGDEPKEEEEEGEEAAAAPRSSRKKKSKEAPKEKGKQSEDGVDGGADGDLDDFVVEDDEDGLLGAPAEAIPLEFTAQAHRPLKDQFPYAVEWLVHNRLNPAFERRDPVYANAWRKLDGEFRGLASSKFASAAWRTEFYRALKGRPKMEAYEMAGTDADKYDNCAACGRSGHPATFKIIFQGTPYHKDTLQEVDDYRDGDADEDDDDDSDNASIDTQGMPLPPASREWCVGSVCCSNAETAHGLIHWKHALMEWVEERLEDEGWLGDAEKARERERMKARQRRDLANRIADAWRDQGVVAALYRDWRNTLEAARTKATTGRGRMR